MINRDQVDKIKYSLDQKKLAESLGYVGHLEESAEHLQIMVKSSKDSIKMMYQYSQLSNFQPIPSACADLHIVPMFTDNYGYIIIDKKDLHKENDLIGFKSDSGSLFGSINVI